MSRYGWELGIKGDYTGAQDAFGQALVIGQRESDATLQMRTLVDACYVDYFHLNYEQSARNGLTAIELALRASDNHAEVEGRYYTARCQRG